MIITPQILVALYGIRLNEYEPFKVGVFLDERKESVVRGVQRSKLWGFPLSL